MSPKTYLPFTNVQYMFVTLILVYNHTVDMLEYTQVHFHTLLTRNICPFSEILFW